VSRPPTTAGLPGGWQSQDVGLPDLGGSARADNGRWTVQGAGANIWGSEDEFQLTSKVVDGNVTLVARVDNLDASHDWAKAGLMVRAGSGPSAPFAGLYRTPGHGVVLETRARYREAPVDVAVDVPDGPVWLKLVRRAKSFSAFYSLDGRVWTRVAARTVAMPIEVLAGLAVTSHDVNRRATATFTGVSVG
jgi:hypothetical protein